MRFFTDLNPVDLDSSEESTAVALGFFDGVHKAHAQVIGAVTASSLVPSVLTFCIGEHTPRNKFGVRTILTDEQKLERFKALGVQKVWMPPFEELADLSPEDFFREILLNRLHARELSCGYDYTFGRNAAGGVELLSRLCDESGVRLSVLPAFDQDHTLVSSTAIRKFLLDGDVPAATAQLGYPYYILGEVVHGRSLGKTLGFPTLNQPFLSTQLVPRYGVYNSTTEIAGQIYASITNIGVKPTIEGERAPLAETYLIGGEGDFYGEVARVALIEMTRPERKFESLDELRDTVHRDIAARGCQI